MENIITYSNHDLKKKPTALWNLGHNKSFFDKIPKKCFVFFEGGRGSTYLACVKLIFSPFLKLFPNFSYTSLLLIFSAIFNEFAFSTTYSGLHLPTGSTVFINYQITN